MQLNARRLPAMFLLAAMGLLRSVSAEAGGANAVIAGHPRLLLTTADKDRLVAKKNANATAWQTLKARADTLATYAILPYKFATSSDAPPNTIYYTYQGEGWLDSTLPLAFAYQMTGDTRYSNKLIELAREMIGAQGDPDNNPPAGRPPIQLDSYYASRNVASSLAFIYDYCYDQLGATLKSQMVQLMNDYFDDVRVNGYQAQDYSWAADGNYFGGHLYGVGLMGYASFGDNTRAQEMIDWARVRFDGTKGSALPASSIPLAWRSQEFEGGARPSVALDFNGPDITGNPFKGGFDFQGWSYGSEEFNRMIDYMLTVKSATGEDLFTAHQDWFSQILRAEKHALLPNRFEIDPTGDWGGNQGALISRGLPVRLAFVLAGTKDGPGAQHFAYSEIAESTIPDTTVYAAPEWVDFVFGDGSRASTELVLPPYYTGYSQGQEPNGAIPYFIMRSDWSATATWASIQLGCQWWDDHQHYAAGHMVLFRGNDYLLVSAGDWKGPAGGSGVLGSSLESLESSLSNTLYFDDFGDFQNPNEQTSGGQLAVGIDQVAASELNADFSYARSDLSSAYNRAGDPSDVPNRKLESFYRNYVYLRAANIFVVYDEVKAKPSSNPKGAYRKHIRWHLPNKPTVTGSLVQVDQGQSRLYLHALLPENARVKLVDESSNPDPCDGAETGCTPFGQANAATWRVEVSDPQNPLSVSFLAVLQPGARTSTAPTDSRIASDDGKMVGVEVAQSGGQDNVVLFNAQPGQVPAPIASTSYRFSGPATATHTLCGLRPAARYAVSYANSVVTVSQDDAGASKTSAAGVLQFSLAGAAAASTALYFPRFGSSDGTQFTGFAVTNLGSTSATLRFSAFDTKGTPITGPAINNPATLPLAAGQQAALVDYQIFGAGYDGQGRAGWVKVETGAERLAGFFLAFDGAGSMLDGADAPGTLLTSAILPEIEENGFTRIHIANPGVQPANVTLQLYQADGRLRGAVLRTIPASGALAELAADLFTGLAPQATDYIYLSSDRGVVPLEFFGRAAVYAESLNGLDAVGGATTLYAPQYVAGGQYRSALSIVNLEAAAATVTLRIVGDSGTALAQPRTLSLPAKGKLQITEPGFFLNGAALVQGYLEITTSGARAAGSIVFGDRSRGSFATALPLAAKLDTSVVFSQVASDGTYYTGIALLNPGSSDANVTIEVFDPAGARIAGKSEALPAHRRKVALLTDFFPALAGINRSSGYIRVTSDKGIAAFALFGKTDLSALSAIPAQSVP